MHHSGVFTVLKKGGMEVQALLKPCGSHFQTAQKKSFTGGLSVKCVAGAIFTIDGSKYKYQYMASTNQLQKITGTTATDVTGYNDDITTAEEAPYWEVDSKKGRADFTGGLAWPFSLSAALAF